MISFDEVLARATSLVCEVSANPAQNELLQWAIEIQAGRLQSRSNHLSFRIPALVYAAIRGDDRPALDLAAAMLILYMGTDLLDDIADGDMAPEWNGEEISQSQLISIGMFATLPQLIIARMDAPPATVVELLRAVLEASARMGAGQRLDIQSRSGNREVSLDEAWHCIELKSGAAAGLLGKAGAILAGVPERTEHYATFGHALGCAYCVMKDCLNLSRGAGSSDLANGTRSYPLSTYLSGLRPEARAQFLDLLADARRDPEVRKEILRRVTSAGTFQVAGLVIESCRARALGALEKADPLEPAASGLRQFIEFARLAKSEATLL